MIFRNFRFKVILRIVIFVCTLFLLVYLLDKSRYNVTAIIVALFAILQVGDLILYVERTNKQLTKFLESIRHSDFVSSFSDKGKGKTFEDLNTAFNKVIEEFRKNRAEKEEHFNYMQTVVQHISIGIIAFRKDGKVDMFNNAVKRLLRISNFRNIQQLGSKSENLPNILLKMKAGDNLLHKIFIDGELMQLAIYATEYRKRGEEYILVSLQDIHSELEEKEVESWQKLIRVFTHEMMNSITPIASLASTVQELLIDSKGGRVKFNEMGEEDVENIHLALSTIESRSQGLINFVTVYRNLTRIPKPNFRYFQIKEIFANAEQLLMPKLDRLSIKFITRVFPDELMVTADPDLMDQVVINLLLNAVDAVKDTESAQISIVASTNHVGRVIVDISDNGHGIKPDILDKIFIPFFTSKKEGSGIGLSLSRQIMHLHKGTISVKSKLNEGTVVTLIF